MTFVGVEEAVVEKEKGVVVTRVRRRRGCGGESERRTVEADDGLDLDFDHGVCFMSC
jgi:hypothetical protein